MADGSKLDSIGFDTAKLANASAVFIDAKLPLADLRKISVLEVVVGDAADDLPRALAWASPKTDIAIWCTETFSAAEQRIW